MVVIFTGDWFFGLLQTHLPPRVVELIPLQALSGLWRWTRYLLLFFFFLLLVLVIYRVGTPRDRAGRRIVRGAALLASLAMVACSVLFSWFIGLSSRYTLVYGSLASLIILLVWLYFCGNILLLGAIFGQVAAGGRRGGGRDRPREMRAAPSRSLPACGHFLGRTHFPNRQGCVTLFTIVSRATRARRKAGPL